VFTEIHLSFLPVGHTHNEVDAIASRYSIGCRNRDIVTRSEMVSVLKHCHNPAPVVEHMDVVADIKHIFNPYEDWEKSRINCFSAKNGATPILANLHHLFKMSDGRPSIFWKKDILQDDWSGPHLPFKDSPSDFDFHMIYGNAVRDMGEMYIHRVDEALAKGARSRMNDEDFAEMMGDWNYCKNAENDTIPFHWADKGRFLCETDPELDEDEQAEADMLADEVLHEERVELLQRIEEAELEIMPVLGDFVAIRLNYGDDNDVAPNKRYKFRLGKVIEIMDTVPIKIKSRQYISAPTQQFSGVYRAWTGRNPNSTDTLDCVLCIFHKLNKGNRIPLGPRAIIKEAVEEDTNDD
jgi:hypothetical protein